MKTSKIINLLKRSIRKSFSRSSEKSIDLQKLEYIERNNKEVFLIDVRSTQEYEEGHLRGAISIPSYEIEDKIEKVVSDKKSIVILYCQTGRRSKKSVDILEKMGYTNVYNIEGGITENS